jgi:hypothetical protein
MTSNPLWIVAVVTAFVDDALVLSTIMSRSIQLSSRSAPDRRCRCARRPHSCLCRAPPPDARQVLSVMFLRRTPFRICA